MKNVILFEGPSALDGAPIVVVATGFAKRSQNVKTGAMIQTFIIRSDQHPLDALATGDDVSICGECRHRPQESGARSCYVNVGQSVAAVYRGFKAGSYRKAMPHELATIGKGRKVRLGAYGDPAAVPSWVWSEFCSGVTGVTGYTHQWRTAPREYALWCMASADTLAERLEAKALGYRVFRVSTATDPQSREVVCPASEEAGAKTDCASCLACGGLGAKAKADITIRIHGTASALKAAQTSMTL